MTKKDLIKRVLELEQMFLNFQGFAKKVTIKEDGMVIPTGNILEPRYRIEPIGNVIRMILDHLGLTLENVPPQNQRAILVKKPTQKKEKS